MTHPGPSRTQEEGVSRCIRGPVESNRKICVPGKTGSGKSIKLYISGQVGPGGIFEMVHSGPSRTQQENLTVCLEPNWTRKKYKMMHFRPVFQSHTPCP